MIMPLTYGRSARSPHRLPRRVSLGDDATRDTGCLFGPIGGERYPPPPAWTWPLSGVWPSQQVRRRSRCSFVPCPDSLLCRKVLSIPGVVAADERPRE